MTNFQKLYSLWENLYPSASLDIINDFILEIEQFKSTNSIIPLEAEWYKDVTVYSLYVDLFNVDFKGLEDKLSYLKDLGISCLWLLPILESPARDAGFDISDYQRIRPDLLGGKSQLKVFSAFMRKAHQMGIKVIFDIALNHTSDQHPWFLESKKGEDNPYRDYYIWSANAEKYKDARIIFHGIEPSNWSPLGDVFYFHRFFDFQPDLNYRNPEVILEMSRNLVFWLAQGVDGFRADAIPYLWKEEETDCENLPQTHLIVKFMRAVVDYVRPHTLLLAEACQKPAEVVKYFGDGDECQAGYHFPLMPQLYKALAAESALPIRSILSQEVTPDIPSASQWFTFLRCHDELSLELVYVSESDRKFIHDSYCHQQQWDFRQGQGISARLANLMNNDMDKIALAYSIMLSLPGTPVIYYGDEFAKQNDEDFYVEQIAITGKDDTRFLVRGRVDWQQLDSTLADENSSGAKVYAVVSKLLKTRAMYSAFGRGNIQWINMGRQQDSLLIYTRNYKDEHLLIVQNLSSNECDMELPLLPKELLLANKSNWNSNKNTLKMQGKSFAWFSF